MSPDRMRDAPWCSDDGLQGGAFCAYQNLSTLDILESPTNADWPHAHDTYARIFEAKRSHARITDRLSCDTDSSISESIAESTPHFDAVVKSRPISDPRHLGSIVTDPTQLYSCTPTPLARFESEEIYELIPLYLRPPKSEAAQQPTDYDDDSGRAPAALKKPCTPKPGVDTPIASVPPLAAPVKQAKQRVSARTAMVAAVKQHAADLCTDLMALEAWLRQQEQYGKDDSDTYSEVGSTAGRHVHTLSDMSICDGRSESSDITGLTECQHHAAP